MSDPREVIRQLWVEHRGMWQQGDGWQCSCGAQLICDPGSWTDARHALYRHLWAVLLAAMLDELAPPAPTDPRNPRGSSDFEEEP